MYKNLNYRHDDFNACNRPYGDRYFFLDGQWFFTTREGVTMGPYNSRAQAITETSTYIEFIRTAKGPVKSVIRKATAKIDSPIAES